MLRLKDDALPLQLPVCPQYVSQTRKRRTYLKKRDFSLLSKPPKIREALVFKEAERQVDSKETEVSILCKNIQVSTSCENNVTMDSNNNFPIVSEKGEDKSNTETNFVIKSMTDERNEVDKTEFEEVGDEATSLFKSIPND